MALKGKRPSAAGANRGSKSETTRTDQGLKFGFVAVADIGVIKRDPMSRVAGPATIEDRLGSKAEAADARDRTGQRSLDQMSDDEIRERLFRK